MRFDREMDSKVDSKPAPESSPKASTTVHFAVHLMATSNITCLNTGEVPRPFERLGGQVPIMGFPASDDHGVVHWLDLFIREREVSGPSKLRSRMRAGVRAALDGRLRLRAHPERVSSPTSSGFLQVQKGNRSEPDITKGRLQGHAPMDSALATPLPTKGDSGGACKFGSGPTFRRGRITLVR